MLVIARREMAMENIITTTTTVIYYILLIISVYHLPLIAHH